MHKKFNSDNKAVYLKERTWILSASYAEEKTYIFLVPPPPPPPQKIDSLWIQSSTALLTRLY